jgi:hypothetical protein
VLLIIGGRLAILPVFGLWMLPLGLMLLADDIPPVRRLRDRALDWPERRRPQWFAAAGGMTETKTRAASAASPLLPRGEGGPKDRMRAAASALTALALTRRRSPSTRTGVLPAALSRHPPPKGEGSVIRT